MFTNPSSASFLIIGLIFESSISNVLFKLEISTFSLLIVLNYLTLLPGSVSRWYLWSGLGCIGIGFVMTTKYN